MKRPTLRGAAQRFAKKVSATDRTRATYNDIAEPGKVSTQSFLRLESTALGTQNQITFNVLRNDGTQNTTERRLALTDSFVVTDIGVFLLKVASGSTNAKNRLQTFPNSVLFSGSGEADNLNNIYQGFINIKIDGRVYLDSLDVMRFYRAGEAQNGVGLSTYDATNNANNKFVANQWDNGSYGFFPLTPTIQLSGARKNEISIQCPESLNMIGTSSTNYCVMILRGFLQQNQANFR